jgi:hypothetical protein
VTVTAQPQYVAYEVTPNNYVSQDGYIRAVIISSGTPPYTYNLVGGSCPAGNTYTTYSMSHIFNDLGGPKWYSVTVTDAIGCIASDYECVGYGHNSVYTDCSGIPPLP